MEGDAGRNEEKQKRSKEGRKKIKTGGGGRSAKIEEKRTCDAQRRKEDAEKNRRKK